ncbi:L-2-hydroxyglutarate oxidase [Nocardioides zeae]|uniref:L-2-hydroxyglutarate oxidase n=1 Tax=Nocardioides imazamoxiresistens TaxID=3231893 RepID=A0ABU3PRU1_9ACTN|nr:L-2-hydroxyglutarate oxidase [Nocardioides zeae]MDT9591495.1 L-2-hydroxyglutarate oxidase [Nocardioides zeae]
MRTYDVVVVGAGIVGLAVAREALLRRPGADVLVVEKEPQVGAHQTSHNSGVVHGGLYYEPGSLKARLCVEGAREMYAYCEEHALAHERCGKLVVALDAAETARLDELERRGLANGVPGLRRVDAAGIREVEPGATGVAALHAPDTGIVDYGAVARTLAAEVASLGGEVRRGVEVTGIRPAGEAATLDLRADGDDTTHVRAARVVVCAGLWADRLARRAGAPADPRIVPFRGAYLMLRQRETPYVRGLVYPVPDPRLPFLGVHVTRHVDGTTSLGPTAMLVPARDAYRLATLRPRDLWETATWPGTWRVARRFWRTGATELRMATGPSAFVAAARRYVPGLEVGDLSGETRAGVRAQAVGRDGRLVDDFVISDVGPVSHLRNAPSPAATSAFALARELAGRVGL